MKEWLVDLYPKDGGYKTQVRIFAPNSSAALASARKQHSSYRTGGIKEVK